MKKHLFTILIILFYVLVFTDSSSQNTQVNPLDSMILEVDWKSALAGDTEAAWLDFILRHWTSNKVNDAVAHFQALEQADPSRSLLISDIDPSFIMGSMMVGAKIMTSGKSAVSYTPVARASVYDSRTKEIIVHTQSMETRTADAFTIEPGSTGTFICVAGAPSAWTGPEYTHYSGRGVVCMFAVPQFSPNRDISHRISNLVIIDADFDKEVAKVLNVP